MRKKLGKLEVASVLGPWFEAVARALGSLAVSIPTIVVECALLIALVWGLVWASQPLAPPQAGQLVISGDPRSQAVFRILNGGIGVYYRHEIVHLLPPVQFLKLSGVTNIDEIATSFDERRIYAVDSENGLLHVVESFPRLKEVKTIFVGKTAKSVALSADGRKLYVGVEGPIPLGNVHIFDADTLEEKPSIENVGCPEHLFVARKRPLLFLTTQCGLNNDPIYVIDTRSDEVIREIPGFATGGIITATNDGSTIYVSSDDGLRIVRDYWSNKTKIQTLPLHVSAMALTPDERTLLVEWQVGCTINNKETICGVIGSIDSATGTPCPNKPMLLEAVSPEIVVAPNGEMMAPLPERTLVGDSRALKCNISH